MKFILSSEEAELLIHFEKASGLEPLSQLLGRDPTVISKQLKRISQKGDFLTKVAGRWALTETGKKLNQLNKDYLLLQNKLTQGEKNLKLGGTREFSANILGKNSQDLAQYLRVPNLSIYALEEGVEQALLAGLIDIGFDCGRPYSPDIAYKQVLKEPIIPVASPFFHKKLPALKKFRDLETFPHILCDRLSPDRVSGKEFNLQDILIRTNDISTAKSICLADQGWALLPKYCIQEELKAKSLVPISNFKFDREKFGVWSLRSRTSLKPFFEDAIKWLATQNHLLS